MTDYNVTVPEWIKILGLEDIRAQLTYNINLAESEKARAAQCELKAIGLQQERDEARVELTAATANLAAANTEIVDLYNALHDIVAETLAHDNTPYIALAKIVKIASDALGIEPVWGGAAKYE